MNYNLKDGTKLTGLGLKLTLGDAQLLTDGEDEWLYHWLTPDDKSYLTTDIELAGLLADGAELTK
jgi:hypothetical protein